MNKTSSQRPNQGTDLSAIFNAAAQALAANQSSLNQADTANQNHGDNMVQAFSMIAQAMASQRGTRPRPRNCSRPARFSPKMPPAAQDNSMHRDWHRQRSNFRDNLPLPLIMPCS